MASKTDKELAYTAGYTAFSTEPVARRNVGSCPFDPYESPEERAEWLAGFEAALNEQDDTTSLRKSLKEAQQND